FMDAHSTVRRDPRQSLAIVGQGERGSNYLPFRSGLPGKPHGVPGIPLQGSRNGPLADPLAGARIPGGELAGNAAALFIERYFLNADGGQGLAVRRERMGAVADQDVLPQESLVGKLVDLLAGAKVQYMA